MLEDIDLLAKILLLVTFLVNCYLTVLVLLKNPRKSANQAFGFLLASIAFWNFTHIIVHTGVRYHFEEQILVWWTRLSWTAAIMIAVLYLNFSIVISKKIIKWQKWHKAIIYMLAFIFAILSLTKYSIMSGAIADWGFDFQPGRLTILFIIYFLFCIFSGVIVLARAARKSKSQIVKKQLKYIIGGTVLSAILIIIVNAIIPLFGTSRLAIYGVPFCLVFTCVVSYVILRYRFLDIKLVFKKGLFYSLLLVMTLALVSFLIYLLGDFFDSIFHFGYIATATFCAFLIALVFQPLRTILYRWLDKIYLHRKTRQEIKESVQAAVKKNADLSKVLKKIAEIIKNDLTTQNFNFLIYDAKNGRYQKGFSTGNVDLQIEAKEYFISVLKRENKIYVQEEIPIQMEDAENDEERDHLEKIGNKLKDLKMSVVIPLVAAEELVAIFFLGAKKNNRAYSVQDIRYLQEIAEEAGFCIANVLLYKQAVERMLR